MNAPAWLLEERVREGLAAAHPREVRAVAGEVWVKPAEYMWDPTVAAATAAGWTVTQRPQGGWLVIPAADITAQPTPSTVDAP